LNIVQKKWNDFSIWEKKNSVGLFCRRVMAVFPERFPDVRHDDQVDDEDGGDGGAQLVQKRKYQFVKT
jgi:hypothetical protein